jgi:hypothetical protein
MPEPIQQRRGQLLIPKDLDPFPKGAIAGDRRGVLAVSLRQYSKEQLAPGAIKGHKTEVIHDQEIDLHQALLDTP